ncbi:hypothetical protein A3A21_03880 [Candidatus Jorgensenbacteria bacterium RIFCSPLOWO2_01_FULL_45_25b]|uniref:Uncharacterized protein n=1 Tax=Candidatus Jorgensenbacteria bacterium RIFCSPLOWO2_01_FULL_45_25b TaxID=1798471 RepID=A0A1F6BWD7_9BACT|nr:MAG: hypothetical protein A3A21_03880 [Candidatus Jorgensenbacteria bacterium RIFCSPLOWO2_01_FULL_45_25b]
MQQVPLEYYSERIDSLPKILKERFFAFETGDTVWSICEGKKLSEEQTKLFAVLSGDVILGFLHPHDFEKEARAVTNIDDAIAHAISEEINLKIFEPVSQDIIRNYKPYVPGVSAPSPIKNPSPLPVFSDALPKKEEGVAINTTLLGLQKKPQVSGMTREEAWDKHFFRKEADANPPNYKLSESTNDYQSANTKEVYSEKPFVLYHEETSADTASKRPSRGFSLPFGFFGKPSSPTPPVSGSVPQAKVSGGVDSASPVRNLASNGASSPRADSLRQPADSPQTSSTASILGKINPVRNIVSGGGKKEVPRIVHYSGLRTQVTPFQKEEELFTIKRSETTNTSEWIRQAHHRPTKTTNEQLKPANLKEKLVSPTHEITQEEHGEVKITKNPFSFPKPPPSGEQKDLDRVIIDGNTVHL